MIGGIKKVVIGPRQCGKTRELINDVDSLIKTTKQVAVIVVHSRRMATSLEEQLCDRIERRADLNQFRVITFQQLCNVVGEDRTISPNCLPHATEYTHIPNGVLCRHLDIEEGATIAWFFDEFSFYTKSGAIPYVFENSYWYGTLKWPLGLEIDRALLPLSSDRHRLFYPITFISLPKTVELEQYMGPIDLYRWVEGR